MIMMSSKDREQANKYGMVSGYAASWIREPDSYGDVIKIHAFKDSIAKIEREGRVLPFLFSHKHDDLSSYVGKVVELEEDEHGLFFTAVFDGSKESQRVRELLENRLIRGFSFAYDVIDQGQVTLADGRKANELRKLSIAEISACLFPANPDTSIVDVKGRKHKVSDVTLIEYSWKKAKLMYKAEKLLRECGK